MREIKFRAWIHEVKQMVDVWSVDFNIETIMWGDDKEETWHNYFSGMKKDCELMQFTGLLDRNGKEVYEGDLVRSDWYEDKGRINCAPVVFVSGRFTCRGLKAYLYEMPDLEVIGNVYENPELLTPEPTP
jgi:hypothetical protein